MRSLVFLWMCVFLAIPCEGRIITVDDDGPADFNNIQAAIDDANDGDEVVLEPGTYTGDGNRDIDFLGKAITVRSTDPNDSNVVGTTVIDCNGTETEWHRGFNFTNGEDLNSVLAGVTIVRGYASGDWPDSMGGGIYCFESSPKIGNCRITGNIARYSGGGIYCYRGSPIIRNCVVSDNTAENWGDGGGINCYDSEPVITNCVISGNSAGGWGGGIYNVQSKLVISNCTIR
ncbi:MAG: right-handed parallel beta-helix repeat-containing protein, partial [Planctomycetota bacterium]